MQITIGTDVEFFLGEGGKFVSAHDKIPGTKYAPHPVIDGAVQVDGVAAEINTLPSTNFTMFKDNIKSVMNQLKAIVPVYDFITDTTVKIDRTIIPPDALRLSCESDFDPYEEDINPSLNEDSDYRSAGGHIHIGGFFPDDADDMTKYKMSIRLARLLDKYVGVYSLLWDKDSVRRQTYGKAGNCRLKEYGLEYRCLSNSWLFNEKVMEFIYGQIYTAVADLVNGGDGDVLYRDIINSGDVNHTFFSTDSVAKEVVKFA